MVTSTATRPAGFWVRFAALWIDAILLYVALSATTAIFAKLGVYIPFEIIFIANSTAMFANNVTIRSTTAPGFMDLQDEMSLMVFENLRMDGTGALCTLRGGSSPPRLRNRSQAFPVRGNFTIPSMTVVGNFQMDVIADVQVGTGSGMSLLNDWNNFASPSACFDWTEGELFLDGGNLRRSPQVFELGGQDFGPIGLGFVNNFAMKELRIGPFTTVNFDNNVDNVPGPGCEVQYVHTLFLEEGSVINLFDCNLYYEELIDDGGTIITNDGGSLVQIGLTVPVDLKPG